MWMRKICLRIKTPNRWSKGKRTNGSRWGFNLTVFSCWLTFSGNGKKEKGLQDLWLCFLPLSRMGVQAKTLQVNILFRLRKILCLTNKCSKDIDIFLDSRTAWHSDGLLLVLKTCADDEVPRTLFQLGTRIWHCRTCHPFFFVVNILGSLRILCP